MTKKRVVIIGGSIAGNTMAVLLERVGTDTWWTTVIQGMAWYVTNPNKIHTLIQL